MTPALPQSCESALLDRFLKAEAMAMWSVRAAQAQDVPPHVLRFLLRHEQDEAEHLRQFEVLTQTRSWERAVLPRVPAQWPALAVHLYGYEALGLEFAKLLAGIRPDLASILEDEERHVNFFEREIRQLLAAPAQGPAELARAFARSWWQRLPRTVTRYLADETLAPVRELLRRTILTSIMVRFQTVGLLPPSSTSPNAEPGCTDSPA